MNKKWNLDNILPEYKRNPNVEYEMENFGKAYPPDRKFAERGAGAALPGLSPCPWCNGKMKPVIKNDYLAVCENDPEHLVQWQPWPG